MNKQFESLRTQYPRMVYRSYECDFNTDHLALAFEFEILGLATFRPTLQIPCTEAQWHKAHPKLVERLTFFIGLIELISYWKVACPPEVIVEAGALNEEELSFWKTLYWGGLGEFFYLNQIETTPETFMTLRPLETRANLPLAATLVDCPPLTRLPQAPVLIPVGGGKDSVVTLECFRNYPGKRLGFAINPIPATLDCMQLADLEGRVCVTRRLDPTLLKLNQEGYLNGHTPFSALLAFVALLTAYLQGAQDILLSNEGSANEQTVHGCTVNHQYSKTTEFEAAFQRLIKEQLGLPIRYLSFLRPLSELAIARLVAQWPQYHPVFRSCNRGSKQNRWCGECAKCLFIALMLSPFVGVQRVHEFIGRPILDDLSLWPVLEQLAGLTASKPFECVGTVAEVRHALALLSQLETQSPALLSRYLQTVEAGQVPGEQLLSPSLNPDRPSEGARQLVVDPARHQKLMGCYYASREFPLDLVDYLPTAYDDDLEKKLGLSTPLTLDWAQFLGQNRQTSQAETADLRQQALAQIRAWPQPILVLGLGREGQAWLACLAQALDPGTPVTIADQGQPDNRIIAWAQELPLKLDWQLGVADFHPLLVKAKTILRSPGISLKAEKLGPQPGQLTDYPDSQILTQADLFLSLAGDQTLAVTGTKGKSTTTALAAHLLKSVLTPEASWHTDNPQQVPDEQAPAVHLLGNIGRAPLSALDLIQPQDRIALELSCHQLQTCRYASRVAVLTNLYPEHLDHYASYADYLQAKLNLLTQQGAEDWAILNFDDEETQRQMSQAHWQSHLLGVTRQSVPVSDWQARWPHLQIEGIVRLDKPDAQSLTLEWHGAEASRQSGEPQPNLTLTALPPALRGWPHAYDYALAISAVHQLTGQPVTACGIQAFKGLPHRCQDLGWWGGLHWYNDSISTIPETCLTAWDLLEPIEVLIVGGMDRGVDLSPLETAICRRQPPVLIALPDTGHQLAKRLSLASLKTQICCVETLEEAVEAAARLGRPGGVCLFSPAAASYHRYRNFEARGEAFQQAVQQLKQLR